MIRSISVPKKIFVFFGVLLFSQLPSVFAKEPVPATPKCIPPKRIIIIQTVYFPRGRFAISNDSKKTLDDVASILRYNPELKTVEIQGFASRSESANAQNLSQQRAEEVQAYLVTKGVEPFRIPPRGMGSTEFAISKDNVDPPSSKSVVKFEVTKQDADQWASPPDISQPSEKKGKQPQLKEAIPKC